MDNKAEQTIEQFFNVFPQIRFNKGKIITRSGEPLSFVYFLEKGLVRQYVLTEDGNDITLHIFKPGSYFPIMLILADAENRFFFEAQTSVTLRQAPRENVIRFLKHNPEVLLDLTKRLSSGIVGLLSKIEGMMYKDALQKIASLFYHFSERYVQTDSPEQLIEVRFTHEQIASILGMQRETVSRQIEKLIQEKVLRYEKRKIVIINSDKLKQIAG